MIQVKKISKEDRKKIDQAREIVVEELVEGSSLFESNGLSRVKVTRDGVEKILVLPIKSGGVSELVDDLNKDAPTPPIVNKLITPDSEIGKELKLVRKKFVQMYDYTDATYTKAKDEHDANIGLTVVLFGVDLPIKDKEGNVLTDSKKKLNVLKNMGLTGNQFTQIFNDIQALTAYAEEEETNFLE